MRFVRFLVGRGSVDVMMSTSIAPDAALLLVFEVAKVCFI
jgi:hypothetical protein